MKIQQASQAKAALARATAQLRQGENGPLTEWLRGHLFSHVLPFWERHAIDEKGGLFTCISASGEVLGTEKWLWSQWRAVWVFSRIYNTLDRDPKWLHLARTIADFCLKSGWDSKNEEWALLVSQDGAVVRGAESIYVDAFAIGGLVELYRACRDSSLLAVAVRNAFSVLRRFQAARDRIPHFPYPIPPGAKPHGLSMMWSLTLADLAIECGEERFIKAAAAFSDEIFNEFYCSDRDMLLERISLSGHEFPAPEGTVVVPGHVIESMWFQIHIAPIIGSSSDRIDEAFRLILRHLSLGWDHDGGGGIVLAIDADRRSEVGWHHPTSKIWWPQTEALYASLLGWEHSRQLVFVEWYEALWDVCLEHFVDWQHGEWRQNLRRDFSPLNAVVSLPVKDPFHLPRSLIYQIELLSKKARLPVGPRDLSKASH